MKNQKIILIGGGLLLLCLLAYLLLNKKKETNQNGGIQQGARAEPTATVLSEVEKTVEIPIPSVSSDEVDAQFDALMAELKGTKTTTGKKYAGADGSSSAGDIALEKAKFQTIASELALKKARYNAYKAKNTRGKQEKKIIRVSSLIQ